jgi:histidinol dehydrogenase
MEIIVDPGEKRLSEVLKRPVQKLGAIKKIVKPILKKVRQQGDKALFKYCLEYDHVQLESLLVTRNEIVRAHDAVSDALKAAIQKARENIERFHRAQIDRPIEIQTMPGVVCKRKSKPIEKVGLYVPGGTAPLFSTVLMLGIPAKLAGCRQILLCTPPGKRGRIHPAILYTADLIGIDRIIKTGGAQAIAAMAFGTESVPKVDKIFGPGNQYVTAAKNIVSQRGTAIDMPAGPSEVAVYADSSSIPAFVASDLLSQAEHGPDSQVLLVATSEGVARDVAKQVEMQLEALPRAAMARESLKNSVAIVVEDRNRAFEIINRYAPEHLIIASDQAEQMAELVENAGSVFLGHFAPESVGDYASGTNHTLPTNGAATAFSGISMDSFVKKITFQQLSPEGIKALGPTVEIMAEAEELQAHKNAVSLRLQYIDGQNGP